MYECSTARKPAAKDLFMGKMGYSVLFQDVMRQRIRPFFELNKLGQLTYTLPKIFHKLKNCTAVGGERALSKSSETLSHQW